MFAAIYARPLIAALGVLADERAKRVMRYLVCLPDTVDPRGPKGK